ncbi:hypothetical protein BDV38DRAFT_7094 [Aspergillus pseudotamarii]|uniref:Uncharacterized protein n=1 Tax=Aspergillus pseudotamarii TaxID=132259 RepID=A0A5N6TCF2_ASPPS|nr:uncharacterized protein BDV38DRAFT_7094 [Aspergillus pseudotamarii]KAE8144068.1 hypothetical protein BDV38DRAFT_7094 [Aspergillus pseudotamarii]
MNYLRVLRLAFSFSVSMRKVMILVLRLLWSYSRSSTFCDTFCALESLDFLVSLNPISRQVAHLNTQLFMCIEYVPNVIIGTKARRRECLHAWWIYLHFPLGPLKTSAVRDLGRLLPIVMPGSVYTTLRSSP